tara:strand:- start:90 stop:530 length:441 start_codon:yes stop_codon:yes gene_type:complete
MPTYTIRYSNFNISKKNMEKIARGVTEAHNIATGANSFFAQVIFEKNSNGSHFMGGKIVNSKEIFLNGQIRSGRTNEIKQNLLNELMKSLIQNSNLKKDNIWIYLEELLPEQMIEYGNILPKSGEEKKWFNNLSKPLKKRLTKIDN